MRISHRELQSCYEDPARWLAEVRQRTHPPQMGYARATVLAIHKFHTTGDLSAASQHLSDMMSRNGLTNPTRSRLARDQLDAYAAWTAAEKPVVCAVNIPIDLPIGGDLTMGGRVSRLDLLEASPNYRPVILGSMANNWSSELRMPLLQRAIANLIHRPEVEVSVAAQQLDGSGLTAVSFSSDDIDEAAEVANRLGATLAAL